jgi:hypothetical protein
MMSPTLTSKNVAHRRGFLTLAVAAAAVIPMSEMAFARDERSHHGAVAAALPGAKTNLRRQKTLETAASLRDLWVSHIFWVRNVSVAAIFKNDSALKTAEEQAVANAKGIAASIEPFYGAAAKDSFFKLLAGHYGAVKAYLVATVASDISAQGTATQALTGNAEEIAVFLSKANPYLPKNVVQGLLLAHGGHHIQQIQQLKDRKYEAEAQTWEEMKTHIYQIADATAAALAKQFVKKFS